MFRLHKNKINQMVPKKIKTSYLKKFCSGKVKNSFFQQKMQSIYTNEPKLFGTLDDEKNISHYLPCKSEKIYYIGQYLFGKTMYTGAIIAPVIIYLSPTTHFVSESVLTSLSVACYGYGRELFYPIILLGMCVFGGCSLFFSLVGYNREKIKNLK
jgi:hypothetical protein